MTTPPLTKINFTPWVGDNYEKSLFGKRILILGESHYHWENDDKLAAGLTRYCIQRQLDGYRQAFWTHIAKAFLGYFPALEDKQKFWHSVAFYNFVQFDVGFGARERPTPEMWTESVPDFEATLNQLAPQLLVVLGYAVWNHLPDLGGHYEPEIREARDTWRYPLPGGQSCLAFSVLHPSSGGFSGDEWHPFIKEAIRRA